jgi:hypothetical protein
MKVFVDTDADIRLARRLERDITERGREIEGVLQQYTRFVKPAYDHYIAPAMSHADLIVPRGEQNNFLRLKYRQRTILLSRENVEYGKMRFESLNKGSSGVFVEGIFFCRTSLDFVDEKVKNFWNLENCLFVRKSSMKSNKVLHKTLFQFVCEKNSTFLDLCLGHIRPFFSIRDFFLSTFDNNFTH